ncbi:MAG: hypothetical protein RCG15_03750 [Candidatus Rickettsia vulgarisii]
MNSENLIQSLQNNKLIGYWLRNGIAALALAGIYSIILVLLRTPLLGSLFSNTEIFRSALVIHVNLSILVWLLSVTAAIWSYGAPTSNYNLSFVILAFFGTGLIALSPICEQNFPVMNNYIPMLENIIFILGISLFGVSVLLFACWSLYNVMVRGVVRYNATIQKVEEISHAEFISASMGSRNKFGKTSSMHKDWMATLITFARHDVSFTQLINFTIVSTTILFILVWLCFLLSYLQLQEVVKLTPISIEYFYELLFWSGGHLLQFVYTQILILVWVILFSYWLGREIKFTKIFFILLNLNFIISVVAIFGHFYDITGNKFNEYYTKHMRYGGGIAPVAAIMVMLWDWRSRNDTLGRTPLAPLTCSILLFLFGGFIGLLIKGMNVTIPAHYHGSIVGISIAFMGFSFLCCYDEKNYLNKSKIVGGFLGETRSSATAYIDVREERRQVSAIKSPTRLVYLKSYFSLAIIILTIGQILHITGLLFAGGYGALRKTPGVEMEFSAKLLMGMMGIGGLIAIVGGLMFVVICGRKIFFKNLN